MKIWDPGVHFFRWKKKLWQVWISDEASISNTVNLVWFEPTTTGSSDDSLKGLKR